MATKAINRYVWLLNTLMQRKSLTFKEICDLWDKSNLSDGKPLAVRTFHQHREAIAELFGAGRHRVDIKFVFKPHHLYLVCKNALSQSAPANIAVTNE